MVGTLIKTDTIDGLFIGLIKEHFYCKEDGFISIEVTWNDCDETTETFRDDEGDYDSAIYHFYENNRWWRIDTNFYMFKRVLEDNYEYR